MKKNRLFGAKQGLIYKMAIILAFGLLLVSCKKEETAAPEEEDPLEEELSSAIMITVKHSITGQPLKDVVLSISSTSAGNEFETFIDRTDQEGKLVVLVPSPNDFQVAVSDTSQFSFEQKDVSVAENDTGRVMMSVLPKFGESTLSIKTTDKQGTAVAEIPFKLRHWDEESNEFIYLVEATTDASGKWAGDLNYPSRLQAVISDTVRFRPDTTIFELTQRTGGLISLQVVEKEYETTTVHLKVKNSENGNAMNGIKVNLYTRLDGQVNFQFFEEASTDGDGNLMIDEIPIPGRIKVLMIDTRYPYAEPIEIEARDMADKQLELSVDPAMRPEFIIDRAGWEVIEFDSETAADPAKNVLDGDVNTNWHTPWQGSPPPWPHYFVVDMKRLVHAHGVAFKNRGSNTNGAPKSFEILVSDNNIDYTSVGTFYPDWVGGWLSFSFQEPISGRYVKFFGIEPHNTGASYTNMSEFGLY